MLRDFDIEAERLWLCEAAIDFRLTLLECETDFLLTDIDLLSDMDSESERDFDCEAAMDILLTDSARDKLCERDLLSDMLTLTLAEAVRDFDWDRLCETERDLESV